jgi:hypothetical protein
VRTDHTDHNHKHPTLVQLHAVNPLNIARIHTHANDHHMLPSTAIVFSATHFATPPVLPIFLSLRRRKDAPHIQPKHLPEAYVATTTKPTVDMEQTS